MTDDIAVLRAAIAKEYMHIGGLRGGTLNNTVVDKSVLTRVLDRLEAYEKGFDILARHHGGDGSVKREQVLDTLHLLAKYRGEK